MSILGPAFFRAKNIQAIENRNKQNVPGRFERRGKYFKRRQFRIIFDFNLL